MLQRWSNSPLTLKVGEFLTKKYQKMKSIKNLKSIQILSTNEKKSINGGVGGQRCCGANPGPDCTVYDFQKCVLQ